MQNASGLTDSILGPFCWGQNFWWQQVGLKERDLIWFGCQNRKYIISKVTSAAHTVWVCSSTAMVLVQFFNSLVLILITDSVVFFIVEFITQSVKRTSWGVSHRLKYFQKISSHTSLNKMLSTNIFSHLTTKFRHLHAVRDSLRLTGFDQLCFANSTFF